MLCIDSIKEKPSVMLSDDAIDCFIKNSATYFLTLKGNISKLSPNEALCAISILTGFKDYFASLSDWEHLTLQALDTLRKGIILSSFTKIAAFSGMSHVAFAIHKLSLKAPNINSFLKDTNRILLRNLTAYLKTSNTEEFLNKGNYEVIAGLSGPLRYLLNFDSEDMQEMAMKIVNSFIKRASEKTIIGHSVTGWHYYPSAIEMSFMDYDTPNGYINYGLSHGMAGPLVALSIAYSRGVRANGLEDTINGIANEFMKAIYYVDDIAYWPGRIKLEQYLKIEDIEYTAGQMSWCYGSVGILRAMFMCGTMTKNQK